MSFGLKENTVNKVKSVLADFPSVKEVIIYGSRAKGDYRRGSDIDLCLRGEGIDLSVLNRIDIALDELWLPYTFDLCAFDHLEDENLIDHIERIGVRFWMRGELSETPSVDTTS